MITNCWCVLKDPESGEERRVGNRDGEREITASDMSPELLAQAARVLGVTEHELLNDPGCLAADPMDLPAARAPDPLPGGEVLAAAFTEPQREKLAKKGHAMKDGSFPIRNRSDLKNAIQAVGRAKDSDAARRWIIKRARALKAVDALPASWAITAAGTFDESKHPRYGKGDTKGGEFAPKTGKLVEGPGGRMMSKTEKGVRMDKAEGRYVKSHSEVPADMASHPGFQQAVSAMRDVYTEAYTDALNAGATDAEAHTEAMDAAMDPGRFSVEEYIPQDEMAKVLGDKASDPTDAYGTAAEMQSAVEEAAGLDAMGKSMAEQSKDYNDYVDDAPDYLNQQTPAARKFAKSKDADPTPEDLPRDPVARAAAQIKPGLSAVTIAERWNLSTADANKAWKLARKRHLREGSVRDETKKYDV